MRHKSSFPICIQWIHRSFGGGSPPTDGILFNQPLETQPQPKVGEDGLPSAINAQRFSMMERKAQPAAEGVSSITTSSLAFHASSTSTSLLERRCGDELLVNCSVYPSLHLTNWRNDGGSFPQQQQGSIIRARRCIFIFESAEHFTAKYISNKRPNEDKTPTGVLLGLINQFWVVCFGHSANLG